MSNRAVVVDPAVPGRLAIKPVPDPVPDRDEAIVRVKALSLNRGEVAMAVSGVSRGSKLTATTLNSRPAEKDSVFNVPMSPFNSWLQSIGQV